MAYTLGGGPNAVQRSKFIECWKQLQVDRSIKLAAVSSSAMVRGIVTAITWILDHPIQTFSPNNMDSAFEYLGVLPTARDPILRVVDKLLTELTQQDADKHVAS